MPLFEELIGHAARRYAQGGLRPDDPITKYYTAALARFGGHAMALWGAASGSGIRCAVKVTGGRRAVCGGYAAGTCLVCGLPSCLEHSHAAVKDGTVICHACVGRAQRQWGVIDGGEDETSASMRIKCLRALGLEPGASEADIKAAFKKLAREHHPDRARTAAAKRKCERRFKEINAAFTWLMSQGEAAA